MTTVKQTDLVNDTTPQLGGNLDGQGNQINDVSAAINAQTGTTYSVAAADNNKVVTLDNGSAIALTLVNGLDTGHQTTFIQKGAGQVTVSASTTLVSKSSATKTVAQYSAFTAIHLGSNIWYITGDIEA